MTKKQQNDGFRTHIAEPRWQQVVSIIIVVLGILFWLGTVFRTFFDWK